MDFSCLEDNALFTIDTKKSTATKDDIPLYSTGNITGNTEKLGGACFNCLSTEHSVRRCPQQKNKLVISYNRLKREHSQKKPKDLRISVNRYHDTEMPNTEAENISPDNNPSGLKENTEIPSINAGTISSDLRNALGLKDNELPPWIRNMKQFGYPLGHLAAAVHRNFVKGEGQDVSRNGKPNQMVLGIWNESYEDNFKYNSEKFIKFPGFNAPVSDEIVDSEKDNINDIRKMVERMELQGMLVKHDSKIVDSARNVSELSSLMISTGPTHDLTERINVASSLTPCKSGNQLNSVAIKSVGGTPILNKKMLNLKLPTPDKFAKDISDIIHFENLEHYTGGYQTVKRTIEEVKNKEV